MIKRISLCITLILVFFLVACDCNKCTKSAGLDEVKETVSKDTKVSEKMFKEKTADGFIIRGEFYTPQSENAEKKNTPILLLHMLGRTKETYKPLIPKLLEKGYPVLAIDFRGHGESKEKVDGKERSFKTFTDRDWEKLPEDADTALKYLESQGYSKIIVIGGSIGANTAIISAAEHPDKIVKVVALSPGIDFRSLKPGNYIAKTDAKILLMAAEDDKYSADSVRELHDLDMKNSEINVYPRGGHGTNLFTSVPASMGYIINWLEK